ncbi:MAG: radical SAM family heme chaperone HemW [Planctomycetota bacterium]
MFARAEPPPPKDPIGVSLYVHVPFCAIKCGYCDFNSYVVRDQSVHVRFLEALDAELRMAWHGGVPVSAFIGGGTPSLLDPPVLERLFEILEQRTRISRCGEVTMEANPESLTREKAAIAVAGGVSRLSLGVQSFSDEILRFLDRPHDADRARRAVRDARDAGVENLSLDLIFAVPGETLEVWERDLASALDLSPDHLSCYGLTYEPGTRLTLALKRGSARPSGEGEERAMFVRTRELLARAGFSPYEISNFAGRGGPCRHNDHYWLQGNYVGVGPGASSHRDGVRGTNLKAVESWASAIDAGLPPTASAETLGPWQRAGEALWLGLRRTTGLDLEAVEKRLGIPVRQGLAEILARHEARGNLERAGSVVRLTDQGLLVADRVGADFLLPEAPDADR